MPDLHQRASAVQLQNLPEFHRNVIPIVYAQEHVCIHMSVDFKVATKGCIFSDKVDRVYVRRCSKSRFVAALKVERLRGIHFSKVPRIPFCFEFLLFNLPFPVEFLALKDVSKKSAKLINPVKSTRHFLCL